MAAAARTAAALTSPLGAKASAPSPAAPEPSPHAEAARPEAKTPLATPYFNSCAPRPPALRARGGGGGSGGRACRPAGRRLTLPGPPCRSESPSWPRAQGWFQERRARGQDRAG